MNPHLVEPRIVLVCIGNAPDWNGYNHVDDGREREEETYLSGGVLERRGLPGKQSRSVAVEIFVE
jgi:hypothetical protein